jgi:ariadne-1
MMARWNAKCSKDGDDLKWLAQFTKECPKCKAVIHKDGGCQYMTCSTCQHRFCWMCLGAFDHKDHACNKLSEEADPTTERALLNKFIHFFSRYQSHQQSGELEDKLLSVAEATMRELSEGGAAWIDVQYVKQATLALGDARAMLKYTYVYGYFLPMHVNRSIFEYLQADLERAVERLSGMLEANGDKDRLKVINAMEYVKQRQKNLLEGLLEGDIGGLGGRDLEQNYKNSVQKYDGWVYNTGR